MPDRIIHQHLSAAFEFPVIFTRNAFDPANPALRDALCRLNEDRRHRALIFVDHTLADAQPGLCASVTNYFDSFPDRLECVKPPQLVSGGEAIKNEYRLVMEIVDTILEFRLCRHSCVIAIGGGAVLDAVGFAASIVHRGLRSIRLPSTTLAQNDSGVGVKTGMNLHGGKNTIGTFHPPFAVVNDFALLETLPDVHWIGGVAEAFKVAMIKDADFFHTLCQDAPAFRLRNADALQRMIIRCAERHLDHIRTNGDPFELGQARPLDFGHWAAHKLESMSNYRITHGEAVATGCCIDSLYAAGQGWLTPADAAALIKGCTDTGFQLWHPEMEHQLGDGTPALLAGLNDFQEHLGGALCITFPDGLGRKKEVNHIDHIQMTAALSQLKASTATCRDAS